MAGDCGKSVDNIITSPLDSNHYKYIRLPNGLKVLLIHDGLCSLSEMNDTRENAAKKAFQLVQDFNSKYLGIKPNETKTESCFVGKKDLDPKDIFERTCWRNLTRKRKYEEIFFVSLAVGVGSFSDPKDAYGLAHFCEHCVFLGTEKYPELEVLESHVAENG